MTESESLRILELRENFTIDELKKQYRKLVLKYHPDRNHGDSAPFIRIQKAYQILLHSKENSPYTHRKTTYNTSQSTYYQERKKAEEAYKERLKYYYVRRKKKSPTSKEDIIENVKYFAFTVMGFIIFFLALIISFAFGAVGVIALFIISMVVFNRMEKKNFKL